MSAGNLCLRGLRGRKYSYCESTTAVHFSDLYRYVEPLCASKDRKTVLAVALSRYGYIYRADPWHNVGKSAQDRETLCHANPPIEIYIAPLNFSVGGAVAV